MQSFTPAFSYMRFSSRKQSDGHSIERQGLLVKGWLERHSEARLDLTLDLKDRAVSGFKGLNRSNPDRYALAAFLKLLEKGDPRIPRGSFLIVESLDRLTREDIQPALLLILGILQAGVRIVQLHPQEMIYDNKSDTMALMLMIVELSRGNSESRMKSTRISMAWGKRREKARLNGQPLTAQTPCWLAIHNAQYTAKPQAVATVRQIFAWARHGYSIRDICVRLTENKHPPLGYSGVWHHTTVRKILRSRAVLGECQLYEGSGKERKPIGDPLPNYFPAILSEDEFYAAQVALQSRTNARGRKSEFATNLFPGFLWEATTQQKLYHHNRKGRRFPRAYISLGELNGGDTTSPILVDAVEEAILSCLRGLHVEQLFPETGSSEAEAMVLSGKIQEVKVQMEKVEAQMMENPDLPALVRVSKNLQDLHDQLYQRQQEVQSRIAAPQSALLGQCQTLACHLANSTNPEETRRQLQALFRQLIDAIYLVAAGTRTGKRLVLQIWFKDQRTPQTTAISYSVPWGRNAPQLPLVLLPACEEAQQTYARFNLKDPQQALQVQDLLLAE